MTDVWTPPRAHVQDVALSGNPDAPYIRRKHLNHETSVRAVGMLYYIGAAMLLLVGIISAIGAAYDSTAENIGMAVAFLVFCALYFWLGRGLRRLNPRARLPAGVVSVIGLIGFPIGTLINGYILYLLFSKKGSVVFSDEYRQIVADTPDIKYRTSIIVWIALGLLMAAMAVIIAAFVIEP